MKLIVTRYKFGLLVKHLLGEATPEEKEEVRRWIADDPSHKSYADDLHKVWKESKRLAPPEPVDAAVAWQRFQQKRTLPATAAPRIHQVRIEKIEKLYAWRLIAAAIFLLFAGIGAWWGLKKGGSRREEITILSINTQSTVRTDTLPDGSRVTLNKFSSLVLHGKWHQGSRIARLTGEAFFQVVHESERPFTVEIGSATIRDVGTSFNVRSLDGSTEVVVEDGAILVTDSAFTVKAAAGERVVIAAGHGGIRKTTAQDRLYQYYRTKKFVCHKTPLPEFVAALNEAYGVKVVLQGAAVRNLLLTATFDKDDLDSILSTVTRIFGLIVEKKGALIILKQI